MDEEARSGLGALPALVAIPPTVLINFMRTPDNDLHSRGRSGTNFNR